MILTIYSLSIICIAFVLSSRFVSNYIKCATLFNLEMQDFFFVTIVRICVIINLEPTRYLFRARE